MNKIKPTSCGGHADNGHDRCLPPAPYRCSKCETEPVIPPEPADVHEAAMHRAAVKRMGQTGEPYRVARHLENLGGVA